MPQKQRAQECCDMQTVGIGIRQDANLVVTKLVKIGLPGVDAKRDADIVNFLRGQNLPRIDFPGIENLTA